MIEGDDESKKQALTPRDVAETPEIDDHQVSWETCGVLPGDESLLQLCLSENENHLLGTAALGFCVWKVADFADPHAKAKRVDLKLPPGVRNISVRLLQSNSVIMSKSDEFAVAGVR